MKMMKESEEKISEKRLQGMSESQKKKSKVTSLVTSYTNNILFYVIPYISFHEFATYFFTFSFLFHINIRMEGKKTEFNSNTKQHRRMNKFSISSLLSSSSAQSETSNKNF